ncbi:MAG: hypothetical protein HKN20_06650 [Gemmatimonadetes bacterium]|nr:hypothetical protein [Gemmatimonadota bacterium]
MARLTTLLILTVLALPGFVFGSTLTADDVSALWKAGVGERVILAKIAESGSTFDLSASEIIDLKKAGIPDSVLEAMIRAGEADLDAIQAAIPARTTETEIDEEDEIPADLGFERYETPEAVEVVLVPYAVPRYGGFSFSYWHGYWRDPWYASVAFDWYYPRYWYGAYCSPIGYASLYWGHYWGHHYYGHYGHHGHHGHHYNDHRGDYGRPTTRHQSVYRSGYTKERSRTNVAARSGTRADSHYRTGTQRSVTGRDTKVITRSRGTTKGTIQRPSGSTRYSPKEVRPSRGTKSTVRSRPQSTGRSSIDRPAPSNRGSSSRATTGRSAGSRSSGSGGKRSR